MQEQVFAGMARRQEHPKYKEPQCLNICIHAHTSQAHAHRLFLYKHFAGVALLSRPPIFAPVVILLYYLSWKISSALSEISLLKPF